MSDAFLMPAPGAKAAKVCGILAIVFALTCAGFPIAILLGILALVQHGKAKRLAKAQPDVYEAVPAIGLVTGIIGLALPVVMLPFVGIVSAIAIPAFLVQREQAREVAVQANLDTAMKQAQEAAEAIRAKAPDPVAAQEAIIEALLKDPLILTLRNPITPSIPALQRGTSGPLGTVMVDAHVEQAGGVTSWSIQFQAGVRRSGQNQILQGEVVTHTQEQVEDGLQLGQPPVEAPSLQP